MKPHHASSRPKGYSRNLARKHLSPAPLGATALDKLRKTHVDALAGRLTKAGAVPIDSASGLHRAAGRVGHDAALYGLMARYPCTLVRRPGVRRREAKHLDAATVAAVLKGAERLRYYRVLVLIAATGLRRGEALGLHWQHVNLKDGSLKVA